MQTKACTHRQTNRQLDDQMESDRKRPYNLRGDHTHRCIQAGSRIFYRQVGRHIASQPSGTDQEANRQAHIHTLYRVGRQTDSVVKKKAKLCSVACYRQFKQQVFRHLFTLEFGRGTQQQNA